MTGKYRQLKFSVLKILSLFAYCRTLILLLLGCWFLLATSLLCTNVNKINSNNNYNDNNGVIITIIIIFNKQGVNKK